MIRLLIFLLSAILIAAVATYLLSFEGRLHAEAFGARIDVQNGAAALFLLAAITAIILATSAFKDIAALPQRTRRMESERRQARGMAALARGIEAVAIGDAASARRNAEIASRCLEDASLTRLLTAEAAQLNGDGEKAESAFSAMLAAPDTEFLGLRGLYSAAMRKNDPVAAHGYAERAFRLRPEADWAFREVFDGALETGAWGAARHALASARKAGLIDPMKADRGEAALLTADAYAAEAAQDRDTALREAREALRCAPGFTPAAVLVARRQAQKGKLTRALKTLESSYAANAHPAIEKIIDEVMANTPQAARAETFEQIIRVNPNAPESRRLEARRRLFMGEAHLAIAELERAMLARATASEFALMSESVAASGAPGAEVAARAWLRKAALAPRDPTPGADGDFRLTKAGWANLVRSFMETGALANPALLDNAPALTADELKQLAPPTEQAAKQAAPIPIGAVSPPKSTPPEPVVSAEESEEGRKLIDAARRVS